MNTRSKRKKSDSDFLKPEVGLAVKLVSPTVGRGVFATKNFEKGEFLMRYQGQTVYSEPEDDTYLFEVFHQGRKMWIDASKDDGSFGRLVNDDHKRPNSKMRVKIVNNEVILCLFAIKNIEPGEEIRYSYGSGYYPWRSQNYQRCPPSNSLPTVEEQRTVRKKGTKEAVNVPVESLTVEPSKRVKTEDMRTVAVSDPNTNPSWTQPIHSRAKTLAKQASFPGATCKATESCLSQVHVDVEDRHVIQGSEKIEAVNVPIESLTVEPSKRVNTMDITETLAKQASFSGATCTATETCLSQAQEHVEELQVIQGSEKIEAVNVPIESLTVEPSKRVNTVDITETLARQASFPGATCKATESCLSQVHVEVEDRHVIQGSEKIEAANVPIESLTVEPSKRVNTEDMRTVAVSDPNTNQSWTQPIHSRAETLAKQASFPGATCTATESCLSQVHVDVEDRHVIQGSEKTEAVNVPIESLTVEPSKRVNTMDNTETLAKQASFSGATCTATESCLSQAQEDVEDRHVIQGSEKIEAVNVPIESLTVEPSKRVNTVDNTETLAKQASFSGATCKSTESCLSQAQEDAEELQWIQGSEKIEAVNVLIESLTVEPSKRVNTVDITETLAKQASFSGATCTATESCLSQEHVDVEERHVIQGSEEIEAVNVSIESLTVEPSKRVNTMNITETLAKQASFSGATCTATESCLSQAQEDAGELQVIQGSEKIEAVNVPIESLTVEPSKRVNTVDNTETLAKQASFSGATCTATESCLSQVHVDVEDRHVIQGSEKTEAVNVPVQSLTVEPSKRVNTVDNLETLAGQASFSSVTCTATESCLSQVQVDVEERHVMQGSEKIEAVIVPLESLTVERSKGVNTVNITETLAKQARFSGATCTATESCLSQVHVDVEDRIVMQGSEKIEAVIVRIESLTAQPSKRVNTVDMSTVAVSDPNTNQSWTQPIHSRAETLAKQASFPGATYTATESCLSQVHVDVEDRHVTQSSEKIEAVNVLEESLTVEPSKRVNTVANLETLAGQASFSSATCTATESCFSQAQEDAEELQVIQGSEKIEAVNVPIESLTVEPSKRVNTVDNTETLAKQASFSGATCTATESCFSQAQEDAEELQVIQGSEKIEAVNVPIESLTVEPSKRVNTVHISETLAKQAKFPGATCKATETCLSQVHEDVENRHVIQGSEEIEAVNVPIESLTVERSKRVNTVDITETLAKQASFSGATCTATESCLSQEHVDVKERHVIQGSEEIEAVNVPIESLTVEPSKRVNTVDMSTVAVSDPNTNQSWTQPIHSRAETLAKQASFPGATYTATASCLSQVHVDVEDRHVTQGSEKIEAVNVPMESLTVEPSKRVNTMIITETLAKLASFSGATCTATESCLSQVHVDVEDRHVIQGSEKTEAVNVPVQSLTVEPSKRVNTVDNLETLAGQASFSSVTCTATESCLSQVHVDVKERHVIQGSEKIEAVIVPLESLTVERSKGVNTMNITKTLAKQASFSGATCTATESCLSQVHVDVEERHVIQDSEKIEAVIVPSESLTVEPSKRVNTVDITETLAKQASFLGATCTATESCLSQVHVDVEERHVIQGSEEIEAVNVPIESLTVEPSKRVNTVDMSTVAVSDPNTNQSWTQPIHSRAETLAKQASFPGATCTATESCLSQVHVDVKERHVIQGSEKIEAVIVPLESLTVERSKGVNTMNITKTLAKQASFSGATCTATESCLSQVHVDVEERHVIQDSEKIEAVIVPLESLTVEPSKRVNTVDNTETLAKQASFSGATCTATESCLSQEHVDVEERHVIQGSEEIEAVNVPIESLTVEPSKRVNTVDMSTVAVSDPNTNQSWTQPIHSRAETLAKQASFPGATYTATESCLSQVHVDVGNRLVMQGSEKIEAVNVPIESLTVEPSKRVNTVDNTEALAKQASFSGATCTATESCLSQEHVDVEERHVIQGSKEIEAVNVPIESLTVEPSKRVNTVDMGTVAVSDPNTNQSWTQPIHSRAETLAKQASFPGATFAATESCLSQVHVDVEDRHVTQGSEKIEAVNVPIESLTVERSKGVNTVNITETLAKQASFSGATCTATESCLSQVHVDVEERHVIQGSEKIEAVNVPIESLTVEPSKRVNTVDNTETLAKQASFSGATCTATESCLSQVHVDVEDRHVLQGSEKIEAVIVPLESLTVEPSKRVNTVDFTETLAKQASFSGATCKATESCLSQVHVDVEDRHVIQGSEEIEAVNVPIESLTVEPSRRVNTVDLSTVVVSDEITNPSWTHPIHTTVDPFLDQSADFALAPQSSCSSWSPVPLDVGTRVRGGEGVSCQGLDSAYICVGTISSQETRSKLNINSASDNDLFHGSDDSFGGADVVPDVLSSDDTILAGTGSPSLVSQQHTISSCTQGADGCLAHPAVSGGEVTEKVKKKKVKVLRPCWFCKELHSNLSRHIRDQHDDEDAVKEALTLSRRERDLALTNFRKQAILEYNKSQLKEKNPSYIKERSKTDHEDLLMCNTCKGFYAKSYFARHRQLCCADLAAIPQAIPLKLLECVTDIDISDDFKATVMARFQPDPVGKLCKTDKSIILYGSRMFDKIIGKRDKVVEVKRSVMTDMRRLAKLMLAFNKRCTGNQKPISDSSSMLRRRTFSILSKAIKDSTKDDETELKAGLKAQYPYLLKRFAKVIKAQYLVKDDKESDAKAGEIDKFVEVLALNQNLLFGDAKYVLNKNRQTKLRRPERLPSEQDVSKLKSYTVNRIAELSQELLIKWEKHVYIELRDCVVSRLTLFNARRGGEPARMTIKEWEDADQGVWLKTGQKKKNSEKKLFRDTKLAYQSGKGNNHLVPILITRDTFTAMSLLTDLSIRESCGVATSNEFVFASTKLSNVHISGWHATNRVCTDAGVSDPSRLTATNMRHRVSTLYAALDLPENDRAHFYRHMGHSSNINLNIYQTPLAEAEIVKVGGQLAQMDGKNPSSQPLRVELQRVGNSSVKKNLLCRRRTQNALQPKQEQTIFESDVDCKTNSKKKSRLLKPSMTSQLPAKRIKKSHTCIYASKRDQIQSSHDSDVEPDGDIDSDTNTTTAASKKSCHVKRVKKSASASQPEQEQNSSESNVDHETEAVVAAPQKSHALKLSMMSQLPAKRIKKSHTCIYASKRDQIQSSHDSDVEPDGDIDSDTNTTTAASKKSCHVKRVRKSASASQPEQEQNSSESNVDHEIEAVVAAPQKSHALKLSMMSQLPAKRIKKSHTCIYASKRDQIQSSHDSDVEPDGDIDSDTNTTTAASKKSCHVKRVRKSASASQPEQEQNSSESNVDHETEAVVAAPQKSHALKLSMMSQLPAKRIKKSHTCISQLVQEQKVPDREINSETHTVCLMNNSVSMSTKELSVQLSPLDRAKIGNRSQHVQVQKAPDRREKAKRVCTGQKNPQLSSTSEDSTDSDMEESGLSVEHKRKNLTKKAKLKKERDYTRWTAEENSKIFQHFRQHIHGDTLPRREDIENFKKTFNIPHDYSKIYIKVFNERKLAQQREKKRASQLQLE